MKIQLIQIDKTQESYLQSGIELYEQRLKNYAAFDMITIHVPKNVRQKSIGEQKAEEAKLLLSMLTPGDMVVVLDEQGKEYSSVNFSKFIREKQNASVKRMVFIIGGPFGFDESVYARAQAKISLSQMTFSHQMIRLFFVEQLYRAYTILKGEKYHHV
jgi:23S rRNA (pseudouridine1915-N3)-methyltransferase